MENRLTVFEQFLLLFKNLQNASRGDPERIKTFYSRSQQLQETVDSFESFLLRTDFERRVFFGKQKHHDRVPAEFPRE